MAGDPHLDPEIRRQVLTEIEDELGTCAIRVNGSHDYYGGSIPKDLGKLIMIHGIQVAVAALWISYGLDLLFGSCTTCNHGCDFGSRVS
jgi:hypothetical protein